MNISRIRNQSDFSKRFSEIMSNSATLSEEEVHLLIWKTLQLGDAKHLEDLVAMLDTKILESFWIKVSLSNILLEQEFTSRKTNPWDSIKDPKDDKALTLLTRNAPRDELLKHKEDFLSIPVDADIVKDFVSKAKKLKILTDLDWEKLISIGTVHENPYILQEMPEKYLLTLLSGSDGLPNTAAIHIALMRNIITPEKWEEISKKPELEWINVFINSSNPEVFHNYWINIDIYGLPQSFQSRILSRLQKLQKI